MISEAYQTTDLVSAPCTRVTVHSVHGYEFDGRKTAIRAPAAAPRQAVKHQPRVSDDDREHRHDLSGAGRNSSFGDIIIWRPTRLANRPAVHVHGRNCRQSWLGIVSTAPFPRSIRHVLPGMKCIAVNQTVGLFVHPTMRRIERPARVYVRALGGVTVSARSEEEIEVKQLMIAI